MKPTKFKKGARVFASTNRNDPAGSRKEWVLEQDVTYAGRWDTAEVRAVDGGYITSWVWADTIELAPEEPYTPQVGDKVRVVHEGVVSEVDGKYFSLKGDSDFEYFPGGGMVVELLEKKKPEPEPYKTGTAIVYKGVSSAYPLLRDHNGWRNHAGELVSRVTDDRVRAGEYDVVYEPKTS